MYRFYLYSWLERYSCYWLVDTFSSFSAALNSKTVKTFPDRDYVVLKKDFHDGSYNHVNEFISSHKKSFYRIVNNLHTDCK